MSQPPQHPTRVKLVETVLELAGQGPLEKLTVDQVLSAADISRGSLYHHFEDFYHLLEVAEAARFSKYVDLSVRKLRELVDHAQTRDQFIEGLKRSTRATNNADVAWMRKLRVLAIARAYESPRFAQVLGQEQDRLNCAIRDIVAAGHARGLVKSELDSSATAIFIQAYTIGRVVDDITPSHMDDEAWFAIIDAIVERIYAH